MKLDPITREAIAILRGGDRVKTIVLLDENGVIIGTQELSGGGIPFMEGDTLQVTFTFLKEGVASA